MLCGWLFKIYTGKWSVVARVIVAEAVETAGINHQISSFNMEVLNERISTWQASSKQFLHFISIFKDISLDTVHMR